MWGDLQGEVIAFMEVTATCQTGANVSELEISTIFPLKKKKKGEGENTEVPVWDWPAPLPPSQLISAQTDWAGHRPELLSLNAHHPNWETLTEGSALPAPEQNCSFKGNQSPEITDAKLT